MKDELLMDEVRNGDVQKLAVLFERYNIKLFNYFLRLSGKRDVSEDLTQDVFFRVLKYRQTFRGESKFLTWMYSIARNVYVDFYRNNKNDFSLDDQYDKEFDSAPLPEENVETDQEKILLHKAMDTLSYEKKEVLILSRFQGLKYDEISHLMDCSLSSVKTRVHRAIKDLRKAYTAMSLKGGLS